MVAKGLEAGFFRLGSGFLGAAPLTDTESPQGGGAAGARGRPWEPPQPDAATPTAPEDLQ